MNKGKTSRRPVQPVDRVAHDVFLSVRNGRMFLATAVKRVHRAFEANGVHISPHAVEVWFKTEYLQDPITGQSTVPGLQ